VNYREKDSGMVTQPAGFILRGGPTTVHVRWYGFQPEKIKENDLLTLSPVKQQ
jgi:hypothetical protein